MYTKYELSILYSCGDIFDNSVERKKKGHIKGRIKRRMPVLNPTMQQVIVYFTYKILIFYLEKLLRNLLRKIAVLIAWKEKDNKYKEEQIGQSGLSITLYSVSLLFCIPNMNFLSYTVVEIALMKNVARKKNGYI